jgi:hypothetical protein
MPVGDALCCFSPMGEPEHAASGAEDSSGSNLEEGLRNVLERVGQGNLTARELRPPDDPEARRSQRQTHGEQASFAQCGHRGRGRRGCRGRDRCSDVPTLLACEFLLRGAGWERLANCDWRGDWRRRRRGSRSTVAEPRNHLQSPIDSASRPGPEPDNRLPYNATHLALANRRRAIE